MSKLKKRGDGEQFARMTQSLLESEAVRTLPCAAFKMLVILAVGARPPGLDRRFDKGRNGTQAVSPVHAERFGFNGNNTTQRSLKILLERGLIIKTREGWKTRNHFALYAVAWLPITHRDGQPLDNPELASDSWLTWVSTIQKAKKKTPRSVPKIGTHEAGSLPIVGKEGASVPVNLLTRGGWQTLPIVGKERAVSLPIVGFRDPVSLPVVGHTLDLSGDTSAHVGNGAGANAAPQQAQPKPKPRSKRTTSSEKAP